MHGHVDIDKCRLRRCELVACRLAAARVPPSSRPHRACIDNFSFLRPGDRSREPKSKSGEEAKEANQNWGNGRKHGLKRTHDGQRGRSVLLSVSF